MGISRREADELIDYGHVKVNGAKVTLGARFEQADEITIRNQPLGAAVDFQYIALNKPIGYVSSRK